MDASTAQKTWELTNNVESVANYDDIYRYDKRQQQDILAAKPWEREYVILLSHAFFICCFKLYVNDCACYSIQPHTWYISSSNDL